MSHKTPPYPEGTRFFEGSWQRYEGVAGVWINVPAPPPGWDLSGKYIGPPIEDEKPADPDDPGHYPDTELGIPVRGEDMVVPGQTINTPHMGGPLVLPSQSIHHYIAQWKKQLPGFPDPPADPNDPKPPGWEFHPPDPDLPIVPPPQPPPPPPPPPPDWDFRPDNPDQPIVPPPVPRGAMMPPGAMPPRQMMQAMPMQQTQAMPDIGLRGPAPQMQQPQGGPSRFAGPMQQAGMALMRQQMQSPYGQQQQPSPFGQGAQDFLSAVMRKQGLL